MRKTLQITYFCRNQQDVYNEQGCYQFNYYLSTSNGRYAPLNAYNINEYPTTHISSYNSVCPDIINTGSGIPGNLNNRLATLTSDDGNLSGKRNLYIQLLNGGNTTELEAEILFAGQNEYAQLYVELMNISPYVDDRQLIDLVNNTGFPELALRNVLVANPHSRRNPEVMGVLLERRNPPSVNKPSLT